ncbi:ribbon-helix-helix domain-containing protein [Candidatus Methanoprimaticola sp. MG2]|uniref:ribbon-helix-helix domain-containing protein n=1 Tax=Candidatus Methanoprimaticola sp. MG2 TaxID=3228838 RepID=UPI0039C73052
MANTVAVKIMIPEADAEGIDRLVEEGHYASRADFCSKAVFLLLTASDGRFSSVSEGAGKSTATSNTKEDAAKRREFTPRGG